MWVNIFANNITKKYLLLTDEDIERVLPTLDVTINSDDILLSDGYELLCANYHTYDGASKMMKKYYPDYGEVKYKTIPINFKQAKDFIEEYHRHHIAPQGYKFAVAVTDGLNIVGVAIAGRPVSRFKDNGKTIEVTRLCVKNGYKNVCSLLYSKVARIAKEMGYEKVITYTLESESGKSLQATGYHCIGISKGGSWNVKSRPRTDKHPTESKKIWELQLVG